MTTPVTPLGWKLYKREKVARERAQGSNQIFYSIREKVLESAQGSSLTYESFVKGHSLICESCTGPPSPEKKILLYIKFTKLCFFILKKYL